MTIPLNRWAKETGDTERYGLEAFITKDDGDYVEHLSLGTYTTLKEAVKNLQKTDKEINGNSKEVEIVRVYKEFLAFEVTVADDMFATDLGEEEWEVDQDFEGNDAIYISNMADYKEYLK